MATNEPPAGMDANEWVETEGRRRYKRRERAAAVEMEQPPRQWYGIVRIVVCWLVLLALALDFGLTVSRGNSKTPAGIDPNTFQVMQVYVEGAFFAICAIGAGIAVYIGTRSGGD